MRQLLGEYYLVKSQSLATATIVEEFFPREIMATLGYLLEQFPREFIASCLMIWSIVAVTPTNQTAANKAMMDYILKIVKESFRDFESALMLFNLVDKHAKSNWPETIYSIVSCLIDKVFWAELRSEMVHSLLIRMKDDSVCLAKSSVFSKCVLLVLNKIKNAACDSLKDDLVNVIEVIVNNNQSLVKKALLIALKNVKS